MAIIDNSIPGASKNNPRTGVKAPRKAKQPPAGAGSPAVADAVGEGTLRAAVALAVQYLAQADAAMAGQYIPPPANPRRGLKVSPRREAAIPQLAALAREFPVLVTGSITPDAMDASVADAAALRGLATLLQRMLTRVGQTTTGRLAAGWTQGGDVYAHARALARHDAAIASGLTPIQQGLRLGRRVATTPRTSAAAQTRATNAAHRAAVAQVTADAAKLAQTQVEARAHAAQATPTPPPATPPVTR